MRARVKRRRGLTRVSSKNQVTLPVDSLRAAGLDVGDELEVTVDGRGRLLLTATADPLTALIGAAPGLSERVDLQRLRDEWER
ncbi:AbrB/MazE/SpoVT family DNA-binding domain-containing protein [Jannaschia sp. R86511]|uniref:AbrB/MazE/SpoVT family DNA-binding domain-containing protein n=1 Tax=Jannaschia sp. R86511 TaxID=3093853 RepID=UPI0036D42934